MRTGTLLREVVRNPEAGGGWESMGRAPEAGQDGRPEALTDLPRHLELADIIDVPAVRALMDDFYELTGLPMSLVDLEDRVLIGIGWQDVCMKFHRVHPETAANCRQSDLVLTQGVRYGEFRAYKCKNGMWDVVTPVLVSDVHVGNVFAGQFFYDDEEPDTVFFEKQAERYGFDRDDYLRAVLDVPKYSRLKIDTLMRFYVRLAEQIAQVGYYNAVLARSIEERKNTEAALRESERTLRIVANNTYDWEFWTDSHLRFLYCSPSCKRVTGYDAAEFVADGTLLLRIIHPDDRAAWAAHDRDSTGNVTFRIIRADGTERWIEHLCQEVFAEDGSSLGRRGSNRDITERKAAETALLESEARYRAEAGSSPDRTAAEGEDLS